MPSFPALPESGGFFIFRLRAGLPIANPFRGYFAEPNGKISIVKSICLSLAAAGVLIVPTTSRAQFADAVISYNSGTGFASGYTTSGAALGAPASGGSVTPFAPPFSKSQLVSIGAGGEITLQMSTPIVNNPSDPYGINFLLFANEFFIEGGGATVSGLSYHPSAIQVLVSPDDSAWYTLNPALAPQPGELFPTSGSGNPQIPVNPALTTSSFTGQNLAGIAALYNGSAGGTGYELAWAQDGNGNSVDLVSADYVQIQVESGVLDLDAVAVTVPEPATWALILAGASLIWMRQRRSWRRVLILAGLLSVSSGEAATLTENFSTNPLQNGWQVFGDTNLFQWDSTNQVLDVTWDSSQPNSYFYLPLGATRTRNDDFTLAFDLQINEAEASGYGFELALGFLNLAEATNSDFQRSTGENSPDLVEFDYFPDVGYGPTVWPALVDKYSEFNYNGPSDYAIYAPLPGDWYHIVMAYTASNYTLVTTMTNFEGTSGIAIIDPLNFANPSYPFTDFRVDTLSINSYQDDGFGDSIYAQGVINNFVVTLPPHPPVQNLTGNFNGGIWQAQFCSQTNWVYTLQRTSDFQCWTNISPTVAGNGTKLLLQDTNPPADKAFYRVSASTP